MSQARRQAAAVSPFTGAGSPNPAPLISTSPAPHVASSRQAGPSFFGLFTNIPTG
jgi:hypothetical protein